MRLPTPLPGLHNVLRSSLSLSYLSSSSHTLLPAATRPPVHVHATHHDILAFATDHVYLESPSLSVRLSPRLHFRPIDLAIHVDRDLAKVVIAGSDGALFTVVDLNNPEKAHVLNPLPGSSGYITVNVAVNHAFIAAAAIDGRVAIWQNPCHQAYHMIAVPSLPSDRVTDLVFINTCLLIAWWSGRLLLYELGNYHNRVLWDMNAVTVNKDIFGRFPGCYVTVRASIIALVTGRGELVFVKLEDGAHVVTKVGKYVKGMCERDNKLNLIIDGSLVTHEWITQSELDRRGVPIPQQPMDETPTTDNKPLEIG